jgi:signal transduction histidine kinase
VSDLQLSTRAFLATLVAASIGVSVVAFAQTSTPSSRDAILAAIFCGLQAIAVGFPLELAPQQKLSLYTVVTFAAVLLFEPGIAVLVAAVGTLLAEVARRQPWYQVLFNCSQTVLQAGAAGLLLDLAGWNFADVTFDDEGAFLAVLGAVSVMHVIDVVAVGMVAGLEAGHELSTIVRQLASSSGIEDLSQFALGLITAIAVDAYVWTLPLLLLLAVYVYRASRRNIDAHAAERRQLEEAERVARAREEFLLMASHELRTPVTSIKIAAQYFTHVLTRGQAHLLSDTRRTLELSEHLLTDVRRLETLVDDLLDSSRIQQGRLDLDLAHVDLVALSRQVLRRVEQSPEWTNRHELVLDITEPVTGFWDRARIDQVLTNLISNAVKYSPGGGMIRIQVRNSGDSATVAVSDAGIGIPSDEQQLLFEPFARGAQRGMSIGGTGLGLYITKQLVQQHGGSVAVESTPGAGTTVAVDLPVHPDHRAPIPDRGVAGVRSIQEAP